MDDDKGLHIGTRSWKYDTWKGLVNPQSKEYNHLLEYSKQFLTAGVDQWFRSLLKGIMVLQKAEVVTEFAQSIRRDLS